jgi:hypothetical protein
MEHLSSRVVSRVPSNRSGPVHCCTQFCDLKSEIGERIGGNFTVSVTFCEMRRKGLGTTSLIASVFGGKRDAASNVKIDYHSKNKSGA